MCYAELLKNVSLTGERACTIERVLLVYPLPSMPIRAVRNFNNALLISWCAPSRRSDTVTEHVKRGVCVCVWNIFCTSLIPITPVTQCGASRDFSHIPRPAATIRYVPAALRNFAHSFLSYFFCLNLQRSRISQIDNSVICISINSSTKLWLNQSMLSQTVLKRIPFKIRNSTIPVSIYGQSADLFPTHVLYIEAGFRSTTHCSAPRCVGPFSKRDIWPRASYIAPLPRRRVSISIKPLPLPRSFFALALVKDSEKCRF